jgi:hypothetical protein
MPRRAERRVRPMERRAGGLRVSVGIAAVVMPLVVFGLFGVLAHRRFLGKLSRQDFSGLLSLWQAIDTRNGGLTETDLLPLDCPKLRQRAFTLRAGQATKVADLHHFSLPGVRDAVVRFGGAPDKAETFSVALEVTSLRQRRVEIEHVSRLLEYQHQVAAGDARHAAALPDERQIGYAGIFGHGHEIAWANGALEFG